MLYMHVGILSAFGSVLSLQAPPHQATPHLHAATQVASGSTDFIARL